MNYDICSVGSALVDFTFSIDKRYERNLISYGIPKGSMTLIEREDQEALIKEIIPTELKVNLIFIYYLIKFSNYNSLRFLKKFRIKK